MKNRFIYIIFAIMLVILLNPYIRSMGKSGHLIATLLVTMIPLASFYSLTEDKRSAIVILLIGVPFIILDCINIFFASRYLMVVAYIFGTSLYFYIIVLLLKNLLHQKVITANLIYCAISIYLLIGIMWGGLYVVIDGISPGSFSGISGTTDLIYFSFVVLTTVGFGDVAPLTILTQRLAVFEAATGGVYMAVIIALIVGRYMSLGLVRDAEEETNNKK